MGGGYLSFAEFAVRCSALSGIWMMCFLKFGSITCEDSIMRLHGSIQNYVDFVFFVFWGVFLWGQCRHAYLPSSEFFEARFLEYGRFVSQLGFYEL